MQRDTGELTAPPVSVGWVEYPDGGGELFGVLAGRGRSQVACSAELAEWRQRERDRREVGPDRAEELAAERREVRAERSASECARRARSRVRRLCRQYGMRYMVTLTFPGEGVHDYDRALRLVQDFIHDHGELLYRDRRVWLAVPELHPGGHGWHWHILVPRRYSKAALLALRVGWTEFLRRRDMPPSGGAIYTRIDVKDWREPRRAAGYAAKYVGKMFESDSREKGRKRYLRPRGLDVQVQHGGAASLDEVRAAMEQLCAETVFESGDAEDWHGPPMVWASW